MMRFDEESTLPKLDLPVLVIAGLHDRMTTPEASNHIVKLLPNGVEFPVATGHLGLWESSTEIGEAISEFAFKFSNRDTKSAGVPPNAVSTRHVKPV
jgi:pimeloyl-ACP methyl ester carboxylesterase